MTPEFIKKLFKEIFEDYVSDTNKAIMINNLYVCSQLKKIYKVHGIDFNRLWRQLTICNQTNSTSTP